MATDNPNENESISSTSMSEYRKTIDLFDDLLQLLGSQTEIDLPQICVVGEQSSGKSSLLGALVPGMAELFPVKDGMCTRIPIVTRLKKLPEGGVPCLDVEEVLADASKMDKKEKQSFKWTPVGRARAQEHLQNLQVKAGIAEARLTVYHPDVSDVILTDLPGLIYNRNGQEEDLIQKFLGFVHSKISMESSLILVVAEGKKNIPNVEAIGLAKKYDKHGRRTIRVWTKCDVFDGPSNKDALIMRIRNSENDSLGDHAVCCRREEDASFDWEREAAFFEEDKAFQGLKHLTTRSLVRDRLPKLQVDLVKKNIPGISQQITDNLESARKQLKEIGEESRDKADIARLLRAHLGELTDRWEAAISSVELQFRNAMKAAPKYQAAETYAKHFKERTDGPLEFQGGSTFRACVRGIVASWDVIVDDFRKSALDKFEAFTLRALSADGPFETNEESTRGFRFRTDTLAAKFKELYQAAARQCSSKVEGRISQEQRERKDYVKLVDEDELDGDDDMNKDKVSAKQRFVVLVERYEPFVKSIFIANITAVVHILREERKLFVDETLRCEEMVGACGEEQRIADQRARLHALKNTLESAHRRLVSGL